MLPTSLLFPRLIRLMRPSKQTTPVQDVHNGSTGLPFEQNQPLFKADFNSNAAAKSHIMDRSGSTVGLDDGYADGEPEGAPDGMEVGIQDGAQVGPGDGAPVGIPDGAADGPAEGNAVGGELGIRVGWGVG